MKERVRFSFDFIDGLYFLKEILKKKNPDRFKINALKYKETLRLYGSQFSIYY